MSTIQGHIVFENTQGQGGRYCLLLPQAMRVQNQRVLRVGVPTIQDLQKWAKKLQSSKDSKQLTLETFEVALQWLAQRRENIK